MPSLPCTDNRADAVDQHLTFYQSDVAYKYQLLNIIIFTLQKFWRYNKVYLGELVPLEILGDFETIIL